MPVTETHMAAGSWDLTLRADTPPSITDRLTIAPGFPSVSGGAAGFGHLIVTAAPVDITTHDWTTLHQVALYTGVYRRQRSRLDLTGTGVGIWLGNEEDAGDPRTPLAGVWTHTATLAQWLVRAMPAANSTAGNLDPGNLTIGTITAPASPATMGWSDYLDQIPRQLLDVICDYFGVEWRVNPNLTVDFAPQVGGNDPMSGKVAITPWWDGPDGSVELLRGRIEVDEDVESYLTALTLRNSNGVSGTASTGATTYTGPDGTPVVWRRFESTNVEDAQVAAQAMRELNRHTTRSVWSARVDHPLPTTLCRLGSSVLLLDPEMGASFRRSAAALLAPDAYTRTLRGENVVILPSRLREVTWPISRGCGVYFTKRNGPIVDLTPHVEWESGPSRMRFGSLPRRTSRMLRGR